MFFITGRYSHKFINTQTTIIHNGFLKGELLPFYPWKRGFVSDYEKDNALVFQITPFGIIRGWKLVYEIEGYGYRCSKLLPDPGPPLKIAFGVALVLICVYILNKITATFIYNDVTNNNYFDPKCPYILKGSKEKPLKTITGLLHKLKEMLINDGRDYAAGRRDVGKTVENKDSQ